MSREAGNLGSTALSDTMGGGHCEGGLAEPNLDGRHLLTDLE